MRESIVRVGQGIGPRLRDIVYVAPSSIHGRGVFAKTRIGAGEYIGRYEGPRAKRNGKYVLWLTGGRNSVGRSGRNLLRYLNHSDRPNAQFAGFELYARRTIRADEEITIDYDP
jgi:uncharacterized protein